MILFVRRVIAFLRGSAPPSMTTEEKRNALLEECAFRLSLMDDESIDAEFAAIVNGLEVRLQHWPWPPHSPVNKVQA